MARRSRRKKQAPAEIKSALIESLDQEGRGVAHVDGKAVFIDGALPNEQVSYQSHRVKESFEVANTVEVLTQSHLRVTPKCKHFGYCGGCKLQHLDFVGQVASKQRLLENDIKHIGKTQPENMLSPLMGPTWGYRHKARLSVKYVTKKERVLVGFNEKGTRYVADMDSCEVLTPAVSALIVPLQEMITQLSLRDKIPQLELAVGEPITSPTKTTVEPITSATKTTVAPLPDAVFSRLKILCLFFALWMRCYQRMKQILKAFSDAHHVQYLDAD